MNNNVEENEDSLTNDNVEENDNLPFNYIDNELLNDLFIFSPNITVVNSECLHNNRLSNDTPNCDCGNESNSCKINVLGNCPKEQ